MPSPLLSAPAPTAAAPLAPITAALAGIAASRGEHAVAGVTPGLLAGTGSTRGERGWTPATVFTGGAVRALLDAPAERWGAAPHAAAALAWKGYSFWLALPAVVGWAAARRVPVLDAANVLVRQGPDRPWYEFGLRRPLVAVLPNDPVAGRPGVRVVESEAALLDVLRGSLVDRHLAPLLTAFGDAARVGRRTLWGSLASGVAHAAEYASDVAPLSLVETVETLVEALRVPGLIDVGCTPDGALDLRRRTCCLAFTVDGLGICRSCCVEQREG